MLPKNVCGIIQGRMMMFLFSERHYGHLPYSTAFARHPSDRTPTVGRYDDQAQAPPPLPERSPGPPGPLRGRECGPRLSQPRYRRARAQALSAGWECGPAAPPSARMGADRDASVASRTPAGDRPRPAYGRCQQRPWNAPLIDDVSGRQDPSGGHRRDGARVSAR